MQTPKKPYVATITTLSSASALTAMPSLVPQLPCFSPHLPKLFKSRLSVSPRFAATPAPMVDPPTKFLDFPHASAPIKELMSDLVDSLESRIGSSLLPCTLPPDVQYFENPTGTAQGRLVVKSGVPSSPVDFILGSWVHCKLPSGGALNITSISAFLKLSTDAPNFVIDIIQSSPTSLVVVLDLTPRKDLVLYPEYLKTFYEDTELDRNRQLLEKLPEVKPYYSPFLYIRAIVSPIAILVRIEAEADKTTRVEEIIRDVLRPAANNIMKVWLDLCVSVGRELGEDELAYLAKRDQVTRNKPLELDLGTSLPRIFGEETAGRVLQALEKIFNG